MDSCKTGNVGTGNKNPAIIVYRIKTTGIIFHQRFIGKYFWIFRTSGFLDFQIPKSPNPQIRKWFHSFQRYGNKIYARAIMMISSEIRINISSKDDESGSPAKTLLVASINVSKSGRMIGKLRIATSTG